MRRPSGSKPGGDPVLRDVLSQAIMRRRPVLDGHGSALCAALVVTLVCRVSAEEKPKNDNVIYPRNAAAQAATPAAVSNGGSGSNSLLLIVAIGAAGAGGWMLWRQPHSKESVDPLVQ